MKIKIYILFSTATSHTKESHQELLDQNDPGTRLFQELPTHQNLLVISFLTL